MGFAKRIRDAASNANTAIQWKRKKHSALRAALIDHRGFAGDEGAREADAILEFGKRFITTFPKTTVPGKKRTKFAVSIAEAVGESPITVALSVEGAGKNAEGFKMPFRLGTSRLFEKEERIARASILFEKNAVIIADLQGSRKRQDLLSRFDAKSGTKWAHYLINSIEEHARKTGFGKVMLTAPERLESYKNPVVQKGTPEETERRKEEIRGRMRRLYYGAAEATGYIKQGDFFVKGLAREKAQGSANN